jgi:hypothetical protein
MSVSEILHGPHTDEFREEIKKRLQQREKTVYPKKRKNVGFVIGNGESRTGFDLNLLMPIGKVFGCNALYRDFTPDLLFCMDEGITWEVRESGFFPFIYRDWGTNGEVQGNLILNTYGTKYPDWGYAAGPTAVRFMCEHFPLVNQIYMLGFDLYGLEGKVNNVYKGTPCYASEDNEATFFRGWVKRLGEVFDLFPRINFFRVGNTSDPIPDEWLKSNVLFISYPDLYSILRGST